VNYTLGMILGVDDFVQESVYHASHREALARLAIGYGTLSGLDVKLEPSEAPGSTETQVRVTKGAALAPSGKLVQVDIEQCCSVSDWARLDTNHKLVLESADGTKTVLPKVETREGSIGTWARAWVTLAFSESKCAEIPLPGDPCRTDDKLTAPSRVEDGFHLDISWQRPDQNEEDALRRYFEWVCKIPVQPDGADLTEIDLLKAIRAEAKKGLPTTGAPTSVPDNYFASTPDASLHYKGELLRAVMRLWITEIRPLWFSCCPGDNTAEWDTVLLTGLWIPVAVVGSDWVFDASRPVELEQTHRPSLLSLRALQEMVRRLEDQFYSIIPKGATTVVTESVFGLPAVVGVESKFARADHTHGTPDLPALARDLSGTLGDGGGTAQIEVVGLRGVALDAAAPVASGQILTYNGLKWAPLAPAALVGDVSGNPGSNRVEKLRGIPVSEAAPTVGQFLSFEGGAWSPKTPPTSLGVGDDLSGTTAAAKVVRIQGIPVDGAAPGNGQVLSFDGTAWKPTTPASGGGGPVVAGGDVQGPVESNRIVNLQDIPVKANSPFEDASLVFNDGAWRPKLVGSSGGDSIARMSTPFGLVGAGQVVVNINSDGIADAFKPLHLYHCKVDLTDSDGSVFRLFVQCEDSPDNVRRFVQLTPIWSKKSVPVHLWLEPNDTADIVRADIDRSRSDRLEGQVVFQFQIFQTPIPAV
jgi:hypothetical protein